MQILKRRVSIIITLGILTGLLCKLFLSLHFILFFWHSPFLTIFEMWTVKKKDGVYGFIMPSVILRPWSTLHERTSILIRSFSQHGIDSKEKLCIILRDTNKRNDIYVGIRSWLLPEHWPRLQELIEDIIKKIWVMIT